MNPQLTELIEKTFAPEDREAAIEQVASIELRHVMANSRYNLNNARTAVVELAEGSLEKLALFVQNAKTDFRDVVWWASLKRQGE